MKKYRVKRSSNLAECDFIVQLDGILFQKLKSAAVTSKVKIRQGGPDGNLSGEGEHDSSD